MITTKFCCENYESRPVKSNTVNISEQKAKMQYNCVYKNYKLEQNIKQIRQQLNRQQKLKTQKDTVSNLTKY